MRSSRSLGRVLSKRFLADSRASTTHAYLHLGVLGSLPQASLRWKFWTLQRHSWSHGQFQLCGAFFNGFLALQIFWTKKVDASQLSGIVELRLFNRPLLFFSSFSCLCHPWPHLWPWMIGSWRCLNFCQPPPWPRKSVWTFFIQNCELRETLPNLREAFQQHIHCGIRPPDNVSVFQWYWECFFFRHMELNSWVNLMTINVIPCDRPNVVSGFSVIRQRVSWFRPVRLSSQIIVMDVVSFRVIRDGGGFSDNMKCSPFFGMKTVFAMRLPAWISDASKFSNSPMSATMRSPFQILTRKQCMSEECCK